MPVWEQVRQPVLALWGTLDRQAVPEESSRIIQQALERGGNTHYTIHFIPGVGHNLNRTLDDGFDHPDSLPADYGDVEASWVEGLAHGLPAASADPAPHQDRQSVALAPLAWYESPWLQLGAFVLLPVAFLSYPLAGAVRRIRGRRGASPARVPARWLAATGVATVLGFLGYFGFMVVTAANIIGPVVLGRPVTVAYPPTSRRRYGHSHGRDGDGVVAPSHRSLRGKPGSARLAPRGWCDVRAMGGVLGPAHPIAIDALDWRSVFRGCSGRMSEHRRRSSRR